MMKRYLWLLLILTASSSWAAQQTVTFPPDYTVRDRATKYNANFTELYRLAHDSYSSLQEYDDGDVVTSSHVLYVSLQDNNTGHPVTDPAWWQEVQTGGGSAPVDSVFGRTGTVTAQESDYSAYYLALATCQSVGEVPTWNGSAFVCSTPTGSGDMTKATYDTGDNGIVDNAEALLGGTWAAPGAIGSTTPAAVTGTIATFDTYNTSATDGERYQLIWNTNDPSITCDAAHNGAFAYRRSDNSFRYCNGFAWAPWPGGAGSSVNIVDTDPTSSSPTGEYWSRESGDLFYVANDGGANDGIFQVAGTWTPDAVTYTLTVTDPGNGDSITCSDSDLSTAINCGNGNSDCSATSSSGASITGMTAMAASGRQFDNWTGDITGSENPTTTALVMDGDRSVGAAFSESSVSCTASATMINDVTYNDWWGGNDSTTPETQNYQLVQNSSSVVICQADVNISNPANDCDTHLEIWSSDGTSQIGGDSDIVHILNSDNQQYIAYQWSTNKPNPAGDYRLVIDLSQCGSPTHMNVGDGDTYSGSSYYIVTSGTQRTGLDLIFKVYIEQ